MTRRSLVFCALAAATVGCVSEHAGEGVPRVDASSRDASTEGAHQQNETDAGPHDYADEKRRGSQRDDDGGRGVPSDGLSASGNRAADGGNLDVSSDAGLSADDMDADGVNSGTARPDLELPGGSLAELRSYSNDLEFGALTLTGALVLEPGDGNIVLDVESLRITDSGGVRYEQTACDYSSPPDMTILAASKVTLEGPIDLDGKSGKRSLDTATCSSCWGVAGGSVEVHAKSIVVDARIDTSGGWGSSLVFSSASGESSGCDGADGGGAQLHATEGIEVRSDGRFHTAGGSGGYGSLGSGEDGADGTFELDARAVEFQEQEPNATPGAAQHVPVIFGSLTIHGSISDADDATAEDPQYIHFDTPEIEPDRVEDFYVLDVPEHLMWPEIELMATNASTDVDLYLLTPDDAVVEASNASGGQETIQSSLDPGSYTLAVSWCCDTPASMYKVTVRHGAIQ